MMFLSIVPSDPNLIQFIAAMNNIGSEDGFPSTQFYFKQIINEIASSWRTVTKNKYEVEVNQHSPFRHTIFSKEPMMGYLENGLSRYDMKETHTKGAKSRVAKTGKNKGVPYLIVPFRHATTEGSRFQDTGLSSLYSKISYQISSGKFQRSIVTKPAKTSGKMEKNAMGEMVSRAEYDWGSRFQPEITEDMSEEQKKTMKRLSGLVAFPGSYMTFRVISKNSPADSWIHPGIEPRHYLRDILNMNQEKIKNIIEMALAMDCGV